MFESFNAAVCAVSGAAFTFSSGVTALAENATPSILKAVGALLPKIATPP